MGIAWLDPVSAPLAVLTAALSPGSGEGENGQPVLDARDLIFRYYRCVEPVLRACSLQICTGGGVLDRVSTLLVIAHP